MSIRNLLGAIVAAVALAACAAPQTAGKAADAPAADAPVVKEAYNEALSTDPAACKAKNGEIQRVCMLGKPMCVISYKDAGKSCTDSSQCSGRCQTEGGAPPNQPATGTCQPTSNPCGCFQLVEKGVAGYPLCAD